MNSSQALLPIPSVAEAPESKSRTALVARRKAFRALHEGGCFVIPNPWDVGLSRLVN